MQAKHIETETSLVQAISTEQAWHYYIVPKLVTDTKMELYIEQQSNYAGVEDELEVLFGKQIILFPKEDDIIKATLGRYYRKKRSGQPKTQQGKIDIGSESFILQLIREAKEVDSSDIHIEIYEEKARIRLRIDGKLVERYVISLQEYPSMINKIKIESNLDISEKRLPQDGRIFFHRGDDKFDIRVSILPTLHGEKIVMRLLNKDATSIDIEQLGFNEKQLIDYKECIQQPNGIILISGPTGSGKTTTLYATLKILNQIYSNIVTIEDPIEYTLEGINQVQLRENIGLTFSSALRTFLRQDPDIIMLGEIRDTETAQMAIRASLTGHLIFSTIHTNSAWGTITRLLDMGLPPFLIASTMNMAVAQRLVRLLCPECKKEAPFNINQFPRNFQTDLAIEKHFVATGCENCFYTGYKGRKAIYEVIPIDSELAGAIKNSLFDVGELLKQRGIVTLSDSALQLFSTGNTSLQEIYPILSNI